MQPSLSFQEFISYAFINLPLSPRQCRRIDMRYSECPIMSGRALEGILRADEGIANWKIEVAGPLFPGQVDGFYLYVSTVNAAHADVAEELFAVLAHHLDEPIIPTRVLIVDEVAA